MEISSLVDPDAPELAMEYEPVSRLTKLDPAEIVNNVELLIGDGSFSD